MHGNKASMRVTTILLKLMISSSESFRRYQLRAIRQILLTILENIVENRHDSTLCTLNAVENQDATMFHSSNDRAIIVAQIAARFERALLEQLGLTYIAVQRHIFDRHLDQCSEGLTQSACVGARWRG